MNISDYLQFLEPIQEQLNKVYSIASLALTVLLCLWLFNFIVGLIQRTYSVGKAIGGFYRNYLHRYLKLTVIKLMSIVKYRGSKSSKEILQSTQARFSL